MVASGHTLCNRPLPPRDSRCAVTRAPGPPRPRRFRSEVSVCGCLAAPGIRDGKCLCLLFTESLQIDRVRNVPTDPAELLRQRGYRVTGQRLTVLRAVSGESHMTADAVAEAVRAEMGAISIQAVYDVLGVLVDVGLIRRIQPAGSPARFEARVSDNHHHVICRICGRTADVDCAV